MAMVFLTWSPFMAAIQRGIRVSVAEKGGHSSCSSLSDEKVRLAGELLLISSRTGKLLNVSIVPDRMESYYSPQLLRRSPSEEFILIGTGGETHGGGLYAFDLNCFTRPCSSPVSSTPLVNPSPHSPLSLSLIRQYVEIITDAFKGVMTPPVLIDVNRDQVEDIIIPLYNSTLFAFDGRTFRPLWNRTFPSSETYRSIAWIRSRAERSPASAILVRLRSDISMTMPLPIL